MPDAIDVYHDDFFMSRVWWEVMFSLIAMLNEDRFYSFLRNIPTLFTVVVVDSGVDESRRLCVYGKRSLYYRSTLFRGDGPTTRRVIVEFAGTFSERSTDPREPKTNVLGNFGGTHAILG